MGVSVYPVLNKEVRGYDATEVLGKALAKAIFDEGSAFAILERFNSQSEEWLAGFIADQTGQEASAIEVPAERWFAPEEGLQAVRSLMEQARYQSQAGPLTPPPGWEADEFANGLMDDLQNLEKVLLLAQGHDAQFHLALDF